MDSSEDLAESMSKRAEIRRRIPTRKSVQEGKPDRIADLLEAGAACIRRLSQELAEARKRLLELEAFKWEYDQSVRAALSPSQPEKKKEGPIRLFEDELCELINRHSIENKSNTPDFLLASFAATCLDVASKIIRERDEWYGVELRPGACTTPEPAEAVPGGAGFKPPEPKLEPEEPKCECGHVRHEHFMDKEQGCGLVTCYCRQYRPKASSVPPKPEPSEVERAVKRSLENIHLDLSPYDQSETDAQTLAHEVLRLDSELKKVRGERDEAYKSHSFSCRHGDYTRMPCAGCDAAEAAESREKSLRERVRELEGALREIPDLVDRKKHPNPADVEVIVGHHITRALRPTEGGREKP